MSLKNDEIQMVSEKFTDNKKLELYNNKKWQKKSESNRLIIIDALLEGHKGHNFFGGPYMFFYYRQKIVKWHVLTTQKLDFCPNTPSMFEKGASLNICTQPQ